MTTVYVKLTGLASNWTKACQRAVSDLNSQFKRNGIKVEPKFVCRSRSPSTRLAANEMRAPASSR
jgi:hypothetical protein